jgi:hypothetical protein
MNAKTWVGLLAAVAWSTLALSQERPPAAKPAAGAAPSRLVRMDLLPGGSRGTAVIRRDLFAPAGAIEMVPFTPAQVAAGGLRSGRDLTPDVAAAPEEAGPSIRYLGYIQSKKGVVALILFGGQAQAVSEGDVIASAWKVVKVTAETLEVQGADGRTRTFALEGERI